MITPIIEQRLFNTQKGFRKGKGTRDAIFQLRMIAEKSIQVNKKSICVLRRLQKAFDSINHEKLLHIMEKAGIPELERKSIKALGLY